MKFKHKYPRLKKSQGRNYPRPEGSQGSVSYPRYFVPTVKGLWGSDGGSRYCYCIKIDKPGAMAVFLLTNGSRGSDSEGRWDEKTCEKKVKSRDLHIDGEHILMKEVTEAEFVLMEY